MLYSADVSVVCVQLCLVFVVVHNVTMMMTGDCRRL